MLIDNYLALGVLGSKNKYFVMNTHKNLSFENGPTHGHYGPSFQIEESILLGVKAKSTKE